MGVALVRLLLLTLILLTGCASQPTVNSTGFEIDTEVGPLQPPPACREARINNDNEVC